MRETVTYENETLMSVRRLLFCAAPTFCRFVVVCGDAVRRDVTFRQSASRPLARSPARRSPLDRLTTKQEPATRRSRQQQHNSRPIHNDLYHNRIARIYQQFPVKH